jgi:hypothetical protein
MSDDRRARAFAVLDAMDDVDPRCPRMSAALRSVLERHDKYNASFCQGCANPPCPDETDILDALVPDE